MIKNILLDLDDTIFDFHRAEAIAVEKTLSEMGLTVTPQMISRYSVLNQAQWKLLELGEITREEVKVRRYRLLFDEIGAELSAREAAKIYERYLSVGHYFVEGAAELLETMYGKYRLYLVSNGTASVQRGRLAGSGIEKYFEEIFISQLVGYNKPDARFFETVFAAIPDFKKEETVIVGDSLSSDIQGGINAGIRTIWFNPHGAAVPEATVLDHIVTVLGALPALIGRL